MVVRDEVDLEMIERSPLWLSTGFRCASGGAARSAGRNLNPSGTASANQFNALSSPGRCRTIVRRYMARRFSLVRFRSIRPAVVRSNHSRSGSSTRRVAPSAVAMSSRSEAWVDRHFLKAAMSVNMQHSNRRTGGLQ